MFKTSNMEIVGTYQEHFRFGLPSDLVASRSKKLESGEFVRLYFSYRLCRYIYCFCLLYFATIPMVKYTFSKKEPHKDTIYTDYGIRRKSVGERCFRRRLSVSQQNHAETTKSIFN